MSIPVACPNCEKKLNAPEAALGKRATCPACATKFVIARPAPVALVPLFDEEDFKVAPIHAEVKPPRPLPTDDVTANDFPAPISSSAKVKSPVPTTPARVPWRMALLMVALLPLAVTMLSEPPDIEQRLIDTLEKHAEQVEGLDLEEMESIEELMRLLPDGKIDGAHLSYFTSTHWLYAALSATFFFGLTFVLFDVGRTQVRHLITSSLATATVGILLLFVFQWLAEATQFVNLRGGNLVLLVLFYIVKLIGFSYRAALDPNVGFLASFAGFTLGVGLCEEFVKAVPVLFRVQDDNKEDDWRTACMWGFASGIGFGVAEGIMYSSDYYNGLLGADIYLVRFISCVALHAVWSAAVGVAIWRNRAQFEHPMTWTEWGLFAVRVVFVSMVLHGLYDTLLKCDHEVWALIVGLASFAWLFAYLHFVRHTSEADPAFS